MSVARVVGFSILVAVSWVACDDAEPVGSGDDVGATGDAGGDASSEVGTDAGSDTGTDTASDTTADGSDTTSTLDATDTSVDASSDAADMPDFGDPLSWSVGEPGPYHVGVRIEEISYAPDLVDGDRELRVMIWYPSFDEEGTPARYLSLIPSETAFGDAQPAAVPDRPVLAFSHGSYGVAEQSFNLCEHFASHGWIVIAPDHTGNTYADLGDPLPPPIFWLRPQDITATLDYLYSLPEDDALAGLASDTVVMAGHSFGGYTTLAVSGAGYAIADIIEDCEAMLDEEVCAELTTEVREQLAEGFLDDRIDLAIPLAPGATVAYSAEGLADIAVPTLLITGALDNITTNAAEGNPAWAGVASAGDLRVDIATAGHMSFTSLCDVVGDQLGNGCGEGFIDPADMFEILDTYMLAFARFQLWSDTSVEGILDGTETVSDDVTLSFGE